ncbi:murein tripeptide/oligopeptide ABC transporter ATP binding protein OppF [Pigmentibacter sp. JX0631]|uniref:murein tripeptide/oligopeptide ABC transporter ATP binding protein OppF n=1 Tax=Pigmentibacter sp. JX0631 TaxID=2976982 RepID=UPI0024686A37|nr:murein tripeptide/oligopeptide ABC transporter ATP binding protein OppF [Pigmentibacter sp. JX0631]WGL59364.1 murein tripeptide/oligopeptide ABC transporter ATP binding protein OppF [Pigmentibacter sp. JX0631]
MNQKILSVENLKVYFPVQKKGSWFKKVTLKAVDGVSFDLHAGETLGVVGESGCGKSTLARAIMRLLPATEGKVTLLEKNLLDLDKNEMREARKDIQMIFQDPLASLNPRMTAGQIIAEPLKTFFPKMSNIEVKEKVTSLMDLVGLIPEHINRYPHEFSGGQCQRIGIARALILNPKIIVCDEPVSALDVSIQAQIVNLLKKLQRELGLTLVFIAHDLSVVKHISDRIMVMYLGKPVEIGTREQIYKSPQHPYTKALLSSVPIPDPELEKSKVIQILQGDLPSPIYPPSGCRFRTRCPLAESKCASTIPELKEVKTGAKASCLLLN